jgi:tetratricopeptide (TPR) repeat protein
MGAINKKSKRRNPKHNVTADIAAAAIEPVHAVYPKRKRIVISAAATFVIAMLILCSIVYRATYRSAMPISGPGQPLKQQSSPSNQASSLALIGKSDEAQKLLDKQTSVGTRQDQANIYTQKSQLSIQSKNYATALSYAKKAETLDPTASSAQAIAVSAEASGDKALALEYYKKELDRVGPSQVKNGNADIENKIRELGQ